MSLYFSFQQRIIGTIKDSTVALHQAGAVFRPLPAKPYGLKESYYRHLLATESKR
ncbi:hypothetical protein GVN20_28960 [Runella sp. CRIBMP]|uniref:hypothetical protein n=1 Tax=Runella sp. CRIBMP TaxID=2683261 RepID=UPI0014132282|nr:hypothetical protein [Runella sp. CRIBMP]NBB23416.1 hypothetical protein [Runella sp. CRIBMP]